MKTPTAPADLRALRATSPALALIAAPADLRALRATSPALALIAAMAALPVLTSCAAGTGHADASLDIAFPLPEATSELDPQVKRAFSTITPMDTYWICK
ncbi:MAG: hypothetical protein ACYTGY_14300, partial [Planctomycetota bacterium]